MANEQAAAQPDKGLHGKGGRAKGVLGVKRPVFPSSRYLPDVQEDADQMAEVVLELSPRRSMLNAVMELVENFGRDHGAPDAAVFKVNLAIDELLTNYVLHRGATLWRPKMEVRVRLHPNKLTLIMLDTGPPFNPMAVEAPPEPKAADDMPVGGLGLHVIRTHADYLEYQEIRGCNVLRLEHNFPKDGPPPAPPPPEETD